MSRRTPVIIDTDPGVDDILAILLAIASPEIEILAYNITFGNTDIDASYQNIVKLHHTISTHIKQHPEHKSRFPNFGGPRKPILARGSARPLQGELHTARYFHELQHRDGLGDISNRHPELDVTNEDSEYLQLQFANESGTSVILNLLQEFPPQSITYIALGPLTSLAQLMREHPAAFGERIGRVVCMGGALDVPGNTTPVAEFNFFADPFAVKELLMPPSPMAGLPLSKFFLVTLDITTSHELPFPVYQQRVDPAFHSSERPSVASAKPLLTHFTSSFMERARGTMRKFGKDGLELHDIVAVWFAIDNPPSDVNPASGWVLRKRLFDIERTGELTRGMLVVDRRDNSAYAPGTNRAKAQEQLQRGVSANGVYWESVAVPAQVEVEEEGLDTPSTGIQCVYRTPGSNKLLELMLKRVWGV